MKRIAVLSIAMLAGCSIQPYATRLADTSAFDAAQARQMAKYAPVLEADVMPPKTLFADKDCYKVVLMETPGDGVHACPAGQYNAYTQGNHIRGDERMTYPGCYTRQGNVATIRWLDGKPKNMSGGPVSVVNASEHAKPRAARCPIPRIAPTIYVEVDHEVRSY